MAERKLNINAPLMSVRRNYASASSSLSEAKKKILEKRHTLPHYNSDMSMDQVTEPVAVPFNWEHIPGRRKGNNCNHGSEAQPPKDASSTPSPRLSPGKSTNATKLSLEKEFKVANKVRPLTHKSNSFNVSVVKSKKENVGTKEETKFETKLEQSKSNVEKEKENDEENDDVYSDALENVSPTESFSMNCSVSGVSGLDTLDAKKSGTLNSTDQQTRDFMMSRFLPAAKAMTLQTPQYSSKKQSVIVEQKPRDLTKLVREEKKPMVNKQITDIIPYSAQCQEEEEEESKDDEVNDYDNSADISAKGCGLLPRYLHIKNSLGLLNSVPGMKLKSQVSLPSSTSEVVKRNKISHLRSLSPVPAVKKAWDAIHKKKSSSGGASPDLQESRKKWTNESNRFTSYSGELLPGRLSPFRRSRAAAAGVSPCRSKPQSPIRVARFVGDSKEAENNLSAKLKFYSAGLGIPSLGAKRSSYSGSLTMEKTLYIDTASTVKLSSINLSSVDSKQRIDAFIAELNKRKGKESSNSTIESSQYIKHVRVLEEKNTLDSDVLRSRYANSSPLSSMLHHHKAKEDADQALTTGKDINQELVPLQLLQRRITEDSEVNTEQIVPVNDSGKGGAESAMSPLPPPLPKSPSESWLWRAMPLVSVKNSSLQSNQGNQSHAKRQDSNTASSNIKWETIVKTSNLHHDHVRYSQELTTHKYQHSKS